MLRRFNIKNERRRKNNSNYQEVRKRYSLTNRFFEVYKNPGEVIAAIEDSPDAVFEMLRPLGLQMGRMQSLLKLTKDFFLNDWEEPRDCYGVGKLGNDSYLIFCVGKLNTKTDDISLKSYITWRKANSK